jgi:hypothetical protein
MSAMPAIVPDFCAVQQLGVSAMSGLMHRSKNTPLLDHLIGAQQNR